MKNINAVIKGRLLYAKINKPVKPYNDENGTPEFSFTLLIPKNDTETIKTIKEAINKTIEQSLANGVITKKQVESKSFHLPLNDGDEREDGGEIYKGMYYIRVKRKIKQDEEITDAEVPPVVVKENGKCRLAEKGEVYNGCYVFTSINFWIYNKQAYGISCSYDSICKHSDGEPIENRINVEETYSNYETISNNKVFKEEENSTYESLADEPVFPF